jgi:hypothetical protein
MRRRLRVLARSFGGANVASGGGAPDLTTPIRGVAKSEADGLPVEGIARSGNHHLLGESDAPALVRAWLLRVEDDPGRQHVADGEPPTARPPCRGTTWKPDGSLKVPDQLRSERVDRSQSPVLPAHVRTRSAPARTCPCLVMKGSPVRSPGVGSGWFGLAVFAGRSGFSGWAGSGLDASILRPTAARAARIWSSAGTCLPSQFSMTPA